MIINLHSTHHVVEIHLLLPALMDYRDWNDNCLSALDQKNTETQNHHDGARSPVPIEKCCLSQQNFSTRLHLPTVSKPISSPLKIWSALGSGGARIPSCIVLCIHCTDLGKTDSVKYAC
jgi:hypothetical protein